MKLSEVLKLREKATPGPWHGDPEGYCEYVWGPKEEMVAPATRRRRTAT